MNGEPIILGLENELMLGMATPEKRALAPQLLGTVIDHLRKAAPSVLCAEQAGPLPGLMMGTNGSRIYVDGQSYLESATPEATTPEEVLAFQRANELLISRALSRAASQCGLAVREARLSRIVTDYAEDPHFCGQHLNISSRRRSAEEMIPFLLPFLVTRFYSGAGGLGPTGWTMTHKNRAVRCVCSPDTRNHRGILNLKDEPLGAAPYKRLHLVHGDATMSELATYLTIGCTALVCAMLDDGVCVGPAFTLEDPVRALLQLDHDPAWTRPLRLRCGRTASGLAIQEHYLQAAERYTRRHVPAWMSRVVQRWRDTLETLRRGPEYLAASLDPYIKARFYGRFLAKRGLTLEQFGGWCSALALVEPHLHGSALPSRSTQDQLRSRLPMVSFMLLEDRMACHRLPWHRLPEMQELLGKLKALDLQFHDIAEDGLYWRLRSGGICDSKLLTQEEIAAAMNTPPATRAQARAKAIRQVCRDDQARAHWNSVVSTRGTMSLEDPFSPDGQWTVPPGGQPKKTS